jgi:hypothetical protein
LIGPAGELTVEQCSDNIAKTLASGKQ